MKTKRSSLLARNGNFAVFVGSSDERACLLSASPYRCNTLLPDPSKLNPFPLTECSSNEKNFRSMFYGLKYGVFRWKKFLFAAAISSLFLRDSSFFLNFGSKLMITGCLPYFPALKSFMISKIQQLSVTERRILGHPRGTKFSTLRIQELRIQDSSCLRPWFISALKIKGTFT